MMTRQNILAIISQRQTEIDQRLAEIEIYQGVIRDLRELLKRLDNAEPYEAEPEQLPQSDARAYDDPPAAPISLDPMASEDLPEMQPLEMEFIGGRWIGATPILKKLKPRDAVFLPSIPNSAVSGVMRNLTARGGYKYVSRTMTQNGTIGTAVWRLK